MLVARLFSSFSERWIRGTHLVESVKIGCVSVSIRKIKFVYQAENMSYDLHQTELVMLWILLDMANAKQLYWNLYRKILLICNLFAWAYTSVSTHAAPHSPLRVDPSSHVDVITGWPLLCLVTYLLSFRLLYCWKKSFVFFAVTSVCFFCLHRQLTVLWGSLYDVRLVENAE